MWWWVGGGFAGVRVCRPGPPAVRVTLDWTAQFHLFALLLSGGSEAGLGRRMWPRTLRPDGGSGPQSFRCCWGGHRTLIWRTFLAVQRHH